MHRSMLLIAGLWVAACQTATLDDSDSLEDAVQQGEVTLWPSTTVPTQRMDSDAAGVELGVKFRSSVAGTITGIRFYKGGSANGGTHLGTLWSSAGQSLGSVGFINETASGWQEARFAQPIAISPNTDYVASYYAPQGRYSSDTGYFTTGRASGPLSALRDGESGGNGVYRYGASSGFPTSSFQATNYHVDVVFRPTASSPAGLHGLNATYFNNKDFTDSKLTRVDATVSFNWGTGTPDASLASDTFSVRWTGSVEAPATGMYVFATTSDDGVRLSVNGQQIINNWSNHSASTNTGNIALTAGQKYELKLEYYENTGSARIQLAWTPPGGARAVIPSRHLFTSSASPCTPSCSGKTCGSDGCGGSCGTCGASETCNASGQCVGSTAPNCSGKVCGPDGAGGSCGTCASGQTCDPTGQCVPATAQLCPAQMRTITPTDVANLKNSGYPAGTKVYVPDGPDPWGGCFPGPRSTGIPAGTTLTAYTGPCSITTAGTVIDAKNVTCTLFIRAKNVVIKNSKITASNLEVLEIGSLTLTDSEIDFGGDLDGQGLTGSNITARRLNLHGGHRQVWCDHCTLEDSFLHDQYDDPTGTTHSSAARVENNSTYRHNTFLCNAKDYPPDSGCSADQTGYADFGPIHDNTMDKNLYMATTSGGYCSYGGWNVGKPFNNDPLNATNIHFTNNVFQRGTSPNDAKEHPLTSRFRYTCGYWGPTTSFKSTRPGFLFTGNRWDDGLLFDDDPNSPWGFVED